MNVVVAAHDLYPDPGSGGTGRYVYETARRLRGRGHDVSVVTRRRGDVPLRGTVDGVDVYRYDLRIAERPAPAVLRDLPGAYRRVADHVADLDPDLVSFQAPVTAPLVDRALDGAIPRCCTFHSPWPTEYGIRTRADRVAPRRWLNTAIRAGIERSVLSRTDAVTTLSEFMRKRLIDRYDPGADVAVVPGGVDAGRFRPDAGVHDRIDGGGTSFLTVRRLSPRMGHDLLLRAFARVHRRHPDAALYVAGDGPLRDRLEQRAAALDVEEATTFLGYVPDDDLPAAYATADVFVLPTTELEGFGLATLEALAAGTPAVGTPVGGTPELLEPCERRAGVPADLLASATDVAPLAELMNTWATLDGDALSRAARACRRYAREEYSWASTVDALEARYGKLV